MGTRGWLHSLAESVSSRLGERPVQKYGDKWLRKTDWSHQHAQKHIPTPNPHTQMVWKFFEAKCVLFEYGYEVTSGRLMLAWFSSIGVQRWHFGEGSGSGG